jgi:hypothetical protein
MRWLPIIIATMLSTIIVMAILLGGNIAQGGWRGQGKLKEETLTNMFFLQPTLLARVSLLLSASTKPYFPS